MNTTALFSENLSAPPPQVRRQKLEAGLCVDYWPVEDTQSAFLEDVQKGLSGSPKQVSPKYFYDSAGSELFEAITRAPEYYPAHLETQLLQTYSGAIVDSAREQTSDSLTLVELGSGSSLKTDALLSALAQRQDALHYIPVDISSSAVTDAGKRLLRTHQGIRVHGLVCDYHQAMCVLQAKEQPPRLFIFLGSSLGNYTPEGAHGLLQAVHNAMEPADRMLIGLDQRKDVKVLTRAYNDAQGATAAFNKNLLQRINRELGGKFPLEQFRHRAFYNDQKHRIEMHLESLIDQQIPIHSCKQNFSFVCGETIHTENSYKYDSASLLDLLAKTNLRVEREWRDANSWFGVYLLAPV